MRVTIKKDGKNSLVLQGEQMALQAPAKGDPLMIEAEFDEGSPIKIVIANGKEQTIPVRQVRLVHKETNWIKSFKRVTKGGIVTVHGHERRKAYRKMRDKHASI